MSSAAIRSKNIVHPDTFDLYKGETKLNKEIEAINQSIRLILTTAKGELFGDPDFGSRLYELLFSQAYNVTSQIIKQEIVESLNKYEPRVYVEQKDIVVRFEDTTVYIDISYNVRYTNYRNTFTFITSIQEGPEE